MAEVIRRLGEGPRLNQATNAKVVRLGVAGLDVDPLQTKVNAGIREAQAYEDKMRQDDANRAREAYNVSTDDIRASDNTWANTKNNLSAAWANTKHIVAQASALGDRDEASRAEQVPRQYHAAYEEYKALISGQGMKRTRTDANGKPVTETGEINNPFNTPEQNLNSAQLKRKAELEKMLGQTAAVPDSFWSFAPETYMDRLKRADASRAEAERKVGNAELGVPDRFDSQQYVNPFHQDRVQRDIKRNQNDLGLRKEAAALDKSAAGHWGNIDSSKSLLANAREMALAAKDKATAAYMYGSDNVSHAGTVINAYAANPSAVVQQAVGMTPYVVGGLKGAATTAGLQVTGDDTNSDRQFRENNGTNIKTVGQEAAQVGFNALNFGANFTGNALLGHLASGGSVSGLVRGLKRDTALGKAVATATPSMLGKAASVTAKPVLLAARDISIAAGTEAAAGYIQTKVQQGWGALDFEKDTGRAATEGAVVGGILGAGMSAPSAVLGGVGNTVKNAIDIKEGITAAKEATFAENIDVNSDKFNPTEAVIKQIARLSEEGADRDEVSANVKQAVEAAQSNVDPIRKSYEQMNKELDYAQELRDEITQYNHDRLSNPEMPERDMSELESFANDIEAKYPKAVQSEVRKAYKEANTIYTKTKEAAQGFTGLKDHVEGTKTTHATVGENVAVLRSETATPEDKAKATAHVRSFPMAYKPEQLTEFADDMSNDLTNAQRTLLREFADSTVKENMSKNMADVTGDLTTGSKQYRSLNDYFTLFAQAVKSNDEYEQEMLKTQFTALDSSFQKKSELALNLLERAQKTGGVYQVIRTKSGEWKINTGRTLDDVALRTNGGFNIHSKSTGLVRSISANAESVAKAHNLFTEMHSNGLLNTAPEPLPTTQATDLGEPVPTMQDVDTQPVTATEPTPVASIVDDAPAQSFADLKAKHVTQPAKKPPERNEAKPKAETPEPKPEVKAEPAPKSEQIEEPKEQPTKADSDEAPKEDSVGEVSNIKTEEDVDAAPVTKDTEPKKQGKGIVAKLTGLTRKRRIEEGRKPYAERDLVVQHFDQSGDNPLVQHEDLVSQFYGENGRALAAETLGRTLSEKEEQHFEQFLGFHKMFSEHIANTFIAKADKYKYQDLVQFLTGDDGKLNPNVVTALALSAHQWIIENGSKDSLTDKEILKLLGLPSDLAMSIPDKVRGDFDRAMMPASTVAMSLGARAYSALGLTTQDTSSADYRGRMESSLGALTLQSLENMGVLGKRTFNDAEYQAMQKSVNPEFESKGLARTQHTYVYPNHAYLSKGRVEVNGYIEDALKGSGGSRNLLGPLFGIQESLIDPDFEKPESFDQQTVKNSMTDIPDKLIEAANKAQQEPYRIRPEMAKLLSVMSKNSESMLKRMLGIDDSEANLNKYHAERRKNMQAKFRNEWQSLTRGLEFVDRTPKDDSGNYNSIYFRVVMWSNQRMGFAANTFNVQTSQIHRAMAGMGAHFTKVEYGPTFDDAGGRSTTYGTFLRAVAAGAEGSKKHLKGEMHGKTVDKADPKEFLNAFQDYLKTPTVQSGVKAMMRVLEATSKDQVPTEADVQAVANTVDEFGMGAASLLSLTELARFAQAQRDGKEFMSSIGIESDGVTNGPAIANTLSGTLTKALAMQFGLVPKEEGGALQVIKNYYDIKKNGSPDYYETFGAQQLSEIENMITAGEVDGVAAKALGDLAGGFGTRGSAKKWATPFNYSAGYPALKAALARELRASILETFEDVAAETNPEIAESKARDVLTKINTVLEAYNATQSKKVPLINVGTGKVSIALNPAKFNERTLTLAQWGALSLMSKNIHGLASERAIKVAAKDYIATRDLNIKMNNLSFDMFNNLHQALVKKFTDEAIERGAIATDAKGNPLEGLSKADLRKIDNILKPYRPIVVSAMSNESGNSVDGGIMMAKKERTLTQENGNKVQSFVNSANGGTMSMELGTASRQMTNPGVGGSAMWVQASDSYISQHTVANTAATNVHDANIGGVNNYFEMSGHQNAGFFDLMVNYRSQVENYNALVRALNGYNVLNEKHGLKLKLSGLRGPLVKMLVGSGNMTQATADKLGNGHLLAALANLKFDSEVNKITFAKDLYSIHQYSGETGELVLGKEHQDRLDEELRQLDVDRETATNHAFELAQRLETLGLEVPKYSAQHDRSMEELLHTYRGKDIPAEEVHKVLEQSLKADDQAILSELYKVLKGILPEGLKFEYVTDSWKGEKRASGWYNPTTNKISIRAAGTQFSRVTPELVLHEMVHAALVAVTANPKRDPEVTTMVSRLNTLREQVAEQVGHIFPEALVNTEEFMAWGLTNPEFQDALSQIIVTKGERNRKGWKSAFSAFVRNVVGILFQGRSKVTGKHITAVEALLIDSADIIQYVSQNNPDRSFTSTRTFNMIKDSDEVLQQAKAKTAREVLESLPDGLSTEFNAHLASVVDGPIKRAYDAIGAGHLDKLAEPVDYVSGDFALIHGLSPREEYVAEVVATLVESTQGSSAHTSVMREMQRMYSILRGKLKAQDFHAGDWSTATATERANAQRMYDHIFNPKATGGKSSHLANFAGLALGSERFNKMLRQSIEIDKSADRTLVQKLLDVINAISDWVVGALSRSSVKDHGDVRVKSLVDRMIEIDIKNRQSTMNKFDRAWAFGVATIGAVTGKGAGKFAQMITNSKLDKSKNGFINASAKYAKVLASDKIDKVPEIMDEMRNTAYPQQRLGALAELANEARSSDDIKQLVESFLRESVTIQNTRKSWIDTTKHAALDGFENGSDFSKETHRAITYTFLRTDLNSLLDGRSFKEVAEFVQDAAVRDREITKLQNDLLRMEKDFGNDMINRAHDLGYYMVTNRAGDGLAKNALSIADGIGTHYQRNKSDAAVIKTIDELASLYALKYLDKTDMTEAVKVMKAEMKRTDGNGVENLMKLHKSAVESSKADFAENPYSMAKGYLPEVTHTYRETRQALVSDEAMLAKEGWVLVGGIEPDPMDTRTKEPMALYMLKDGGIQRIVSGAVTLDSTHAKGTTVTDGLGGSLTAQFNKTLMNKTRIRAKVPHDRYSPLKIQGNRLIPAYAADGSITDYRYEMQASTRDETLSRNNNFGDLLGAYMGKNVSAEPTLAQNKKIVNALFDDYASGYQKDPRAFVAIGPNSTDPHLAELWRMLPYELKQEAENLWGKGNPMMVRNHLVNVSFGYKKYSVAEMFDKASGERNFAEKMFVGLIEGITGSVFQPREKAKLYAVRGERFIQEVMKKVKDIIVIRTASVLWGNLKANALLHLAYGVSPWRLIADTSEALRAGISYRKQRALMIQAEVNLRAGTGDLKKWENQLMLAQDAMVRNPLLGFIEEGMMPSIVEDVELGNGDYTYQTAAADKVDKYINKVPKSVRTVGSWAMVSPETPAYKFLAGATQFSDFTAKYVLYKHLTTRKDAMSHADAIQEASDAFINYDVPTGRGLQYMNDMGLLMFTKFFIRFQRIIMRLMKTQPALVMGQHFATEWLTNTPGVLDPALAGNLGIPLRSSIFQAPSALDDIVTFKTLF